MAERAEVVVIGSGAGGGIIASELAHKGRKVVLLEFGNHVTARNFLRFELAASRSLWWPIRFAQTHDNGATPIAMVAGRCVGGGTTINTKIALRAPEFDFAKWYAASATRNENGRPFSRADLDPYYARVEAILGVRQRTDWPLSVKTVERGFRALGAELSPVRSYTNYNCTRCGQCLQGCPTNSGQSSMIGYIHPAVGRDKLDLRANCNVTRVKMERRNGRLRATGVDYVDENGTPQTIDANC
jgi:choline dehydrogenase-like flavoprotein